MIIPKQFLKTIKRTGLGVSLFYEMRYGPDGSELPSFVLNKAAYRKACILVAGDNFGAPVPSARRPASAAGCGLLHTLLLAAMCLRQRPRAAVLAQGAGHRASTRHGR